MEHPAGKAMASDEQGELGFSSLTESPVQKSSIFKHELKAEKLLDVRMQ